MPDRMRRGLSFANVVSVVALFVALSAGAYAALGKNSIGAKQIKKNAVRAAEVKADSIGSAELAGGSVTGPKVADGAVGDSKLQDGSVSGGKVADGSLNAADVGEASFFDFAADVGTVPASTCVKRFVTGLPQDARDHLVLTPSHEDVTSFHLSYYAAFASTAGEMVLTACNHSGAPVDDAITHFNLLVIDAQ